MSRNIKPLSNNVLLEIIKEEVSAGGIVIVAASKNTPNALNGDGVIRAKVLAVGPGERDRDGNRTPMSVKVGETVVLHYHGPATLGRMRIAASEMEEDWDTLIMVTEDKILAVLDKVEV